jgi:hypothetical protein
VTKDTPPTFIVQAENDPVDNVQHSLVYYVALMKAGVPTEMHLYATGRHGFGLRRTKEAITAWPDLVEVWFRSIGSSRALDEPQIASPSRPKLAKEPACSAVRRKRLQIAPARGAQGSRTGHAVELRRPFERTERGSTWRVSPGGPPRRADVCDNASIRGTAARARIDWHARRNRPSQFSNETGSRPS